MQSNQFKKYVLTFKSLNAILIQHDRNVNAMVQFDFLEIVRKQREELLNDINSHFHALELSVEGMGEYCLFEELANYSGVYMIRVSCSSSKENMQYLPHSRSTRFIRLPLLGTITVL